MNTIVKLVKKYLYKIEKGKPERRKQKMKVKKLELQMCWKKREKRTC